MISFLKISNSIIKFGHDFDWIMVFMRQSVKIEIKVTVCEA